MVSIVILFVNGCVVFRGKTLNLDDDDIGNIVVALYKIQKAETVLTEEALLVSSRGTKTVNGPSP